MSLLDVLMRGLSLDCEVDSIHIGDKWILSVLKKANGQLLAGVASAPGHVSSFQVADSVKEIIAGLRQKDPVRAAIALATINALLPEEKFSQHDAADWLSAKSEGKNIAIFGRFPFIEDEIRPFAKQVFVFEQQPEEGEYSSGDMKDILPQADIIAITGSAILNRTIDSILACVEASQTVLILGPSTPLTGRLFDCGISALFGVRVADIDAARNSVGDGVNFQKMQGLERVSLVKS